MAVVALAFLQGVAWGCSEVIQVKLGGICSVAGAPPPPPPNARLDVWPCLALTSGSALLLVSPLAALLVHRKIKNADVQLIALGVWLGSAVLLLSVGVVSPESFGSSDSASSGESAISGGSVSSTGVGGDHAVVVEVVAWVGIVINASCLAVLRPLLAILTADQVLPECRNTDPTYRSVRRPGLSTRRDSCSPAGGLLSTPAYTDHIFVFDSPSFGCFSFVLVVCLRKGVTVLVGRGELGRIADS